MEKLANKSARPGFLIMLVTLMIGCGVRQDEKTEIEPVPVTGVQVQKASVSVPISASGILQSKREIKLSFKISGIVEQILVDEGERVHAGQVMARLDLSEIEAQVRQAKSAFEKAERDLTRIKRLYADSAVALEQMQNAETGYQIAQANIKIAEFNFEHSVISAPADGTILRKMAEPNELIGPGMPIFIFAAGSGEWHVRIGMADRDIVKIRRGDSASIQFDAHPDEKFWGTVSEIAGASDFMSGTFAVKIRLLERNHKLISGFVAHADIYPRMKEDFYIIPVEALVEADGNEGFVYLYNAACDCARRKSIRIAHLFSDRIAVADGLSAGDLVIARGAAYLIDGARVRLQY